MKNLLIVGVAFVAQTALASSILTCTNIRDDGGVGGTFELSQNDDQSPKYRINSAIIDSFNDQGMSAVPPLSGSVKPGAVASKISNLKPDQSDFMYSGTIAGGVLSISPELVNRTPNGKYVLVWSQYQVGSANFEFQPGECTYNAN